MLSDEKDKINTNHFATKSEKTEEEITTNRTSLFIIIMKMALNFHIWQNIFLADFVISSYCIVER